MRMLWIAGKGWGLVLAALTVLAVVAIAYAGAGPTFFLVGGMQIGQDPNNAANDVITLTTGAFPSPVIGAVTRTLTDMTKVADQTDELSLKYFFVGGRTCAGGAPRIQLAVSLNGGPKPDGNAFGYVGTTSFGGGCAGPTVWTFNDFTDTVPRWDLSQFNSKIPAPAASCGGNAMTCTWVQVETYFSNSNFPNQRVIAIVLADDACSFAAAACGTAYYDLVTLGNRTLETSNDVEGR